MTASSLYLFRPVSSKALSLTLGLATVAAIGLLHPDPSLSAQTVSAKPSAAERVEVVLYRFVGGPNGTSPTGKLVRDNAGNLFGTTADPEP
jgi:hypothetical protein